LNASSSNGVRVVASQLGVTIGTRLGVGLGARLGAGLGAGLGGVVKDAPIEEGVWEGTRLLLLRLLLRPLLLLFPSEGFNSQAGGRRLRMRAILGCTAKVEAIKTTAVAQNFMMMLVFVLF
jgi:hypothetical protein